MIGSPRITVVYQARYIRAMRRVGRMVCDLRRLEVYFNRHICSSVGFVRVEERQLTLIYKELSIITAPRVSGNLSPQISFYIVQAHSLRGRSHV